MPVTMTYDSLASMAASWLDRTDLTTYIPQAIDLAERRIAREIRPRGFEVYSSSTMTSGTAGAIISQPARLDTIIAWHVLTNSTGTTTGDVRSTVYRRPYDFCRDYWPDQTQTGKPQYYADMNSTDFLVVPSPQANYVFQLAYYERLASLSTSNATNWLTANTPGLLLYGTLLEMAPFLKNDPRIATWTGLYDREAAAVMNLEKTFQSDDATTEKAAAK